MLINNIFKKSTLASLMLVSAISLTIMGCDDTPEIKVSDAELFSFDWWKKATLQDVKSLVKQKVDFNRRNQDNRILFGFVIANVSDPEIIDMLAKNGANVNAVIDNNGVSALSLAVIMEKASIAETLIKNGADVNSKDNNGITPLMKAAETNRSTEIMSLLLKNGAEINAENVLGFSALADAVSTNPNPDISRFLIMNGANTNISIKGGTLLNFSTQNPNEEVYSYILDSYFKKLSEQQRTDICLGFEMGKMDVVANVPGGGNRLATMYAPKYSRKYGTGPDSSLMQEGYNVGSLNKQGINHLTDEKCIPLMRDLNTRY